MVAGYHAEMDSQKPTSQSTSDRPSVSEAVRAWNQARAKLARRQESFVACLAEVAAARETVVQALDDIKTECQKMHDDLQKVEP